MPSQTRPVVLADGFTDATGAGLRDLPFLAPGSTTRPTYLLRPAMDGAGFQISMTWQQLADMWHARSLKTRAGAIITLGIPLTRSGVDLFATIRGEADSPAGQLWYAFDDGTTGAPAREDWRGTATLYYRPIALVTAVGRGDRELL